jgi:uncharacterized protein (TIGR00369 family)
MTEFIPKNEEYAAAVRNLYETARFHKTANIKLDEVRPGYVTARMDWAEGLTQQNGYIHAGVLVGLADVVGGLAAYSLMAQGENVLSVNFAVSMLRPARGGTVVAEGEVIRAGKRLYVCEARLYGDENREELLVTTTITLTSV